MDLGNAGALKEFIPDDYIFGYPVHYKKNDPVAKIVRIFKFNKELNDFSEVYTSSH